jgi:hypothetical protein
MRGRWRVRHSRLLFSTLSCSASHCLFFIGHQAKEISIINLASLALITRPLRDGWDTAPGYQNASCFFLRPVSICVQLSMILIRYHWL